MTMSLSGTICRRLVKTF